VAESEATGLVLVADGCGGIDLCATALQHVAATPDSALLVRVISWGHGFGRWHADLTDVANHERWACRMAAEARDWHATYPQVPIYLVGKSGGCGIVARALEELPPGLVEGAVMLAPALSPGYDLTRALMAVSGEIVVFWSRLDVVVLGLGTWLFGTIDRVRSVSAGMVGFREAVDAGETSRLAYARLRQVEWRPAMAWVGYLGGHVGPDSPAFLRRYVVPLLTPHVAAKP
jgi:hypothetical protein